MQPGRQINQTQSYSKFVGKPSVNPIFKTCPEPLARIMRQNLQIQFSEMKKEIKTTLIMKVTFNAIVSLQVLFVTLRK